MKMLKVGIAFWVQYKAGIFAIAKRAGTSPALERPRSAKPAPRGFWSARGITKEKGLNQRKRAYRYISVNP
jgi:hypothetical protein